MTGRGDRSVPTGDYSGDVVVSVGGQTHRVPCWVRIDRKAVPQSTLATTAPEQGDRAQGSRGDARRQRDRAASVSGASGGK